MEEHLHVQEESRFGSEAVVYSFVSEEGKHLFHVFPIDEEGDIIDEKVRTEDMTDRTVDRGIPSDIRNAVEEYVEERRREEVIRELEHELGTPDLREFPVAGEEAEQVKNEYESGELSLFELEERLEEILSRNE